MGVAFNSPADFIREYAGIIMSNQENAQLIIATGLKIAEQVRGLHLERNDLPTNRAKCECHECMSRRPRL